MLDDAGMLMVERKRKINEEQSSWAFILDVEENHMPDDERSAHCKSRLILTKGLIVTDESFTSANGG